MARLAGVNVPSSKRLVIALTYILGIGKKYANDICTKVSIDKNKRVNDLTEDDKDLVSHLIFTAKNIAKEKNIEESGYRLFFNCNEDGGQTIYHIHLHLVGGKKL